ncbi:MAG: hypothetical protein JNK58_01710 [Phycisphaerae bacterium]|nr:hypothetical protein [Phycisphaerae bacterium]
MRSFSIFSIVIVALALFVPVAPAVAETPAIDKLVVATGLKLDKAATAAVGKQAKTLAKSLARLGKLVQKDAPEATIRNQAEIVIGQLEQAIERAQTALDKALAAAELKLDKLVAKNPQLEGEAAAALAELESRLGTAFSTMDNALQAAIDGLSAFANYVDPTPPVTP